MKGRSEAWTRSVSPTLFPDRNEKTNLELSEDHSGVRTHTDGYMIILRKNHATKVPPFPTSVPRFIK